MLLLACLAVTACSSTTSVRGLTIASAPPAAIKRIAIVVDQTTNNEQGEASALQTGLLREFRGAGYEIGDGGLSVRAKIIMKERGSTLGNVMVGMGVGSDEAEALVEVTDSSGNLLIAFTVNGEALDKRYTSLHEVIANQIPRKIRKQLQDASR